MPELDELYRDREALEQNMLTQIREFEEKYRVNVDWVQLVRPDTAVLSSHTVLENVSVSIHL